MSVWYWTWKPTCICCHGNCLLIGNTSDVWFNYIQCDLWYTVLTLFLSSALYWCPLGLHLLFLPLFPWYYLPWCWVTSTVLVALFIVLFLQWLLFLFSVLQEGISVTFFFFWMPSYSFRLYYEMVKKSDFLPPVLLVSMSRILPFFRFTFLGLY